MPASRNVESRVASTGGQLRNRPEWRAGAVGALESARDLQLSAAATYVGSSLDSSIATGDVRLDAYTRVDVECRVAGLAAPRDLSRVDNLTDQQYQEFVGYVARGIMPRAGVRLKL